MDFQDDDIIAFFGALNRHNVHYILVGGFAVSVHGYKRGTDDVDIWMRDTELNRKNFVSALKSIGIEGAELFTSLPFIAGYSEVILESGVKVDLMSDLQFFKQISFDECFSMAINAPLKDGTNVKVLHINTLISEKEQSKRPKDNLDAEELKKFYRR